MTAKEERAITWVIPGLMTATLSLVGWMGINIQKMAESLAVVAFRVEAQATYTKELNIRIRTLELATTARGILKPMP